MQLCGTATAAAACVGWEKKMYLCILMIHVCIEREKKNLVQFPIDSSLCGIGAAAAIMLAGNFFLFVYFNDKKWACI